jgi:ABC-type multidrug transport system fused ATPase/permease subunit
MTLYFFTVFVFLLGVISFITQFFLTQFFLSDFGKMFPFAKSYVEYIPIMITTSLLGFCVLTAFAFFKKYFLTKIDTNSRNGIKKRVFERLETLRKEANFLETILKFSDLTKEEKTFYSQKLSLTNSRFKTLLDEYYQHFKDKK